MLEGRLRCINSQRRSRSELECFPVDDINVYVRRHKNATVYARNFVYSELLFIVYSELFANGDVFIRFNGKDDNIVLEYDLQSHIFSHYKF